MQVESRTVPLGGRYFVSRRYIRIRMSGHKMAEVPCLVHACVHSFNRTPIRMGMAACYNCGARKPPRDVILRAFWWSRAMGSRLYGWEMWQANVEGAWKRSRG